MTAAELLSRCRALGIDVAEGPGGALLWEADADPPADLLVGLTVSKVDILALLRQGPLWDPAEADRLLAELRIDVERIKADFGNRPPAPLAMMLADALAIGARYIRDHDAEAARGWDALALLADLPPLVRDCLRNWEAMNGERKSTTGGVRIEMCGCPYHRPLAAGPPEPMGRHALGETPSAEEGGP
jgi:hypothetical protein